MNTNRRIRGPELDFDHFLWFVGIWLLISANPVMKQANYFIEKSLYIYMVGTQFVSTNLCLVIILKVSGMLSSSLLNPPHRFDISVTTFNI